MPDPMSIGKTRNGGCVTTPHHPGEDGHPVNDVMASGARRMIERPEVMVIGPKSVVFGSQRGPTRRTAIQSTHRRSAAVFDPSKGVDGRKPRQKPIQHPECRRV